MGYFELVDRYTKITMEIGYVEKQAKIYDDLSFVRTLERLREEQKEVEKEINRYNGVEDEC